MKNYWLALFFHENIEMIVLVIIEVPVYDDLESLPLLPDGI